MVEARTSGYDVIFQISEAAANKQIGSLGIDQVLTVERLVENLNVRFEIWFDKPSIRFISPTPQPHDNAIILQIPFSNSSLKLSSGTYSETIMHLEGVISVLDGFRFVKHQVEEEILETTLSIDFKDREPGPIFFSFSESSKNEIEGLISQIRHTLDREFPSLEVENFEAEMEARARDYLVDTIGDVDLGQPIQVYPNTADSTTMKDVEFKQVYDLYQNRGAMTYFITFGGSQRGDLELFDEYLIVPYQHEITLLISNRYLLEKKVIPMIEDSLNISDGFQSEGNGYVLKEPVDIAGRKMKIVDLGVNVWDDHIKISFRGRDSAAGIDVLADAEITIRFELPSLKDLLEDPESLLKNGYPILIKADYRIIQVRVDIEEWVYALAWLSGPLGHLAVIKMVEEIIEVSVEEGLEGKLKQITSTAGSEPVRLKGVPLMLWEDIFLDDLGLLGQHFDPTSFVRILDYKGIARPVSIRQLASAVDIDPPFNLSQLAMKLLAGL